MEREVWYGIGRICAGGSGESDLSLMEMLRFLTV